MLYQAPNPEIYEGLFHDTQTSHDTFTDHDDFTRSKTNYLDQFERMLAMEQSRQSSQTSIETFHTYDDSIPESNIFYEQVGYGFEQHYQQGYDPETVWFTEASFTDRV